MKKIFIWCSPGSGSSLLSGTLNACGMQLGNEKTYYHEGSNFEHALINSLHSEIASGKKVKEPDWLVKKYNTLPGDDVREKYRIVLRSYMDQAKEQNWKCFGIKSTTGHNPSICFEVMKMHEQEWGSDVHYFLTIRHPLGVLKRLEKKNSPDAKNPNMIYHNWTSHLLLKFALIRSGATVVRFPEYFKNGAIKDIVHDSGLEWTKEAREMFNASVVTNVGEKDADKLLEERPSIGKAYDLLLGACRYG